MKRQIVIDSEARKKLQEVFGVSRVTVWKALNYESENVSGKENTLYRGKGNGWRRNKRSASRI